MCDVTQEEERNNTFASHLPQVGTMSTRKINKKETEMYHSCVCVCVYVCQI